MTYQPRDLHQVLRNVADLHETATCNHILLSVQLLIQRRVVEATSDHERDTLISLASEVMEIIENISNKAS